MWVTPVFPFLSHHLFVLFLFFFPEAMDDLGAGGCCGSNSCDCCSALQDLRATNTHTHPTPCDFSALALLSYLHY